jgi:hypothetical protein
MAELTVLIESLRTEIAAFPELIAYAAQITEMLSGRTPSLAAVRVLGVQLPTLNTPTEAPPPRLDAWRPGPKPYFDFELEIDGGTAGYTVRVLRSPAGEEKTPLALPLDPAALAAGEAALDALRDLPAARQFGRALFDAVVTGGVRSLYDVSRDRASSQGRGLRLVLRTPAALVNSSCQVGIFPV